MVRHASILGQLTDIDAVCESGYLHSTKKPDSDDAGLGELPALPLDTAISESEPSDGDFSMWSDFSEPEPKLSKAFLEVLEPFRPSIVQELMTKFLAGQQNIRACAPSGRENASAASSQSLVVPGLENSNSLASVGLKRNHGREARRGGEEDDEDNQQPSRKRVLRSPDDSHRQLVLACHFCKNNPRRYRRCFSAVLKDISRVK